MATTAHAASFGGEASTLGAGIAEHAAAATLPVVLESTDSHALSSVMHTFGERVVAANRRAKSEGGARSHLSGIASAVGSLLGFRLEGSPPRNARAQEQQDANVTNADARVEPPASDNASVSHDAALHHRSVTEVGANGPAPEPPHGSERYNIHTPNSTLPYGENSPQQNLVPGPGPSLGGLPVPKSPGISSEAFPLPSGNRSEHGSRASGMSELRKCELEASRKSERVLSHSSGSPQPLQRQKPKTPVMQKSMLEQHQARLLHRGPTLGTLVKLRITSNRNP